MSEQRHPSNDGMHRRTLVLFRVIEFAAAAYMLAFVFWDNWLLPGAWQQTLSWRVAGAIGFVLAGALSFVPALTRQQAELGALSIWWGLFTMCQVFVLLPNGFIMGLPGVYMFGFAILVYSTSRRLLWANVLGFLLWPILALFQANPEPKVWIQYAVFLLCGASMLVILGDLLIRRLRKDSHYQAKLSHLAFTDGLTGVLNRRRFFQLLHQQLQNRSNPSMALLAIDIDHFKSINDRHGHLTGDVAIQTSATIIAAQLRPSDVIARTGGEEFAVMLPQCSLDNAKAVAERIRQAVANTPLVLPKTSEGEVLHLTLSIGIAISDSDDNSESLMHRADQQLYAAKHSGRNCVKYADFAQSGTLSTET